MLDAIADATQLGPADIGTVVNTHANGDHTHGNGLLPDAEIIASAAAAEEMEAVPPETLAAMVAAAPDMGEVGEYFLDIFGMFDFANVNMRKPTFTFDRSHSMTVGDKRVELTNVGPAHTAGDVLVHLPGDKVVYTGDILFIEGTPLMWDGPVGNWLAACDLIMDMDVEAIVPGHGPITDKAGVQRVKDYLEFVNREARQRYDAGMPWEEAATDIHLGEFAGWGDSERIAVNVNTLYKEYAGADQGADIVAIFGQMARVRNLQRQQL